MPTKNPVRFEKHIFTCVNERPPGHPRGCCLEKGGADIRSAFVRELARCGLRGQVRANKSGCLDACELGATVVIYPAGLWYLGVKPKDVAEIVETSVEGDGVVERLLATPDTWNRLRRLREQSNRAIRATPAGQPDRRKDKV